MANSRSRSRSRYRSRYRYGSRLELREALLVLPLLALERLLEPLLLLHQPARRAAQLGGCALLAHRLHLAFGGVDPRARAVDMLPLTEHGSSTAQARVKHGPSTGQARVKHRSSTGQARGKHGASTGSAPRSCRWGGCQGGRVAWFVWAAHETLGRVVLALKLLLARLHGTSGTGHWAPGTGHQALGAAARGRQPSRTRQRKEAGMWPAATVAVCVVKL